jgi:hypothetical protein
LLQQESRERELEDEVAKHDQTEDKVYTAVGVLIKQFVELPHEEYIQAGVITSALQEGASRMAGKGVETEGAEGFPIIPKSAMLSAGLGVNFCCTCGISGGQKPPANVNTANAAGSGAWMSLTGKSASQTSTGWGGPASKAIDGNSASNYPSASCTHTHRHQGAWWQVNLGSSEVVSKVKVTNRGDCCGSRLNGFNVIVGSTTCASNVQISQGQTKEIPCAATGNTVKIQLRRNDYLTLCEVGVFVVSGGSWINIVGKSASQTSTGWGGPASKAVDGNSASNYPSGSCTHTHRHQGAWWQVNLGSSQSVQKVKVTNRGDCCGSRLNGFNVIVGSTTCASNVQISQGQTKEVACSATGSTVKIQLRGNDYLTLCEVGVFAR